MLFSAMNTITTVGIEVVKQKKRLPIYGHFPLLNTSNVISNKEHPKKIIEMKNRTSRDNYFTQASTETPFSCYHFQLRSCIHSVVIYRESGKVNY